MALDEAILDRFGAGSVSLPPTLRLYGWNPPALSLGRRQRFETAWAGAEVARVRRPTAGGAVLHQNERTYALVGRLRSPAFPRGVLDTYGRISAALAEAMRDLGADARSAGADARGREAAVCFEGISAHEITVAGRKLIGSAQLRRGGAFLQHGSIPLGIDRALLERVVGRATRGSRFTDLDEATGRAVDAGEVDRAIVRAFEKRFGVELRAGELTAEERESAERYRESKYLDPSWTRTGRLALPSTA